MSSLTEEVCNAWKNRNGAVVLTTIGKDGVANSIYVTCAEMSESRQIVVADNYFDKTRKNILDGSAGIILFKTKEGKAYQIKGCLEYHKDGNLFDFMKSWNPKRHPGLAAVILVPEKVYSGAKQIC
jgi:predicted pyridoxine 5'-phosphate oxidase superfamily flavin-nucleotide-binding protein